MKAKGRYVWQDKRSGNWLYEARVSTKDGPLLKKQRTAKTRSEAVKLVETLYQELSDQSLSSVGSLNELVAQYLSYKSRNVRPVTLANDTYLLQKYILPTLGSEQLAAFSPQQLWKFFLQLEESNLSTATLNKLRTLLNSTFKFGVAWGHMKSNPVTAIRPFNAKAGESTLVQEAWTVDEARAALEAVSGTELDFYVHATVLLGLRKGEVMALRWSDLNLEQGILEVSRSRSTKRLIEEGRFVSRMTEGDVKTKASRRRLRLTGPILGALMRQRELSISRGYPVTPSSHIVLGVKGFPISETTLYKLYNRLCGGFQLRRIRIHDHRHTAAVIALSNSTEPVEAAYGLGHSSFEVTKRIYAPLVPRLSESFSQKLSEAVSGDLQNLEGVLSAGEVKT